MRVFLRLALGVLFAAGLVGCGPQLSEDELGRVIYGQLNIPGAGQVYELPEPKSTDTSAAPESVPPRDDTLGPTAESQRPASQTVREDR